VKKINETNYDMSDFRMQMIKLGAKVRENFKCIELPFYLLHFPEQITLMRATAP